MSFMHPELTFKMPHYQVDTRDGIYYVPGNLAAFSDQPKFLKDKVIDHEDGNWHVIAERLQPYVEPKADEWVSVSIVFGYLGRYQAPGYLDSTDWHFGTNKRVLERELREAYGD